MELAWGIVIIILGVLAWGGQGLSWLSPETGARFGLMEAEDSVDPVYWADIRGEARWDLLSLWVLPLAGILLILDHSAWAYLGLIAGGAYAYFAGRGILTRLEMQRRGHRIGEPSSVRVGLVMLGVWGVASLITIALAIAELA